MPAGNPRPRIAGAGTRHLYPRSFYPLPSLAATNDLPLLLLMSMDKALAMELTRGKASGVDFSRDRGRLHGDGLGKEVDGSGKGVVVEAGEAGTRVGSSGVARAGGRRSRLPALSARLTLTRAATVGPRHRGTFHLRAWGYFFGDGKCSEALYITK
jgi:hypothetical protein